jgi:hypothetical protein
MSRLVVIRVGNPSGTWAICNTLGRWSSPECHNQAVRHAFNEGYAVYGLFVGTGDIPLMAAKITDVRQRMNVDVDIPLRNDIGSLQTIITFDLHTKMDFLNLQTNHYDAALEYVKYKYGSQILIPYSDSENFILYFNNTLTLRQNIIVNRTVINPHYLTNLNIPGC